MDRVVKVPRFWAMEDIKKDFLFFSLVGFFCGILQFFGFNYFEGSQWGSQLLNEHLAFHSMGVFIILLLIFKYVYFLSGRVPSRIILQLVNNLSDRAVVFSSVATSAVFGFAVAAAVCGSIFAATKIIYYSVYFFSISEVAANCRFLRRQSTAYPMAMALVIATPFLLLFN